MFTNNLFNLHDAIGSRMSRFSMLLLATLLVVVVSLANLSIAQASINTSNGISETQRSDFRSLTESADISLLLFRPGHDFGATDDPSVLVSANASYNQSADIALAKYLYAEYGIDILGRLNTQPLNAPLSLRLPGHDFGAIDEPSVLGSANASQSMAVDIALAEYLYAEYGTDILGRLNTPTSQVGSKSIAKDLSTVSTTRVVGGPNASIDQAADIALAEYLYAEYGTDILGRLNTLSFTAPVSLRFPGHDFGAIYGTIDPGTSMPAKLPLFTYWIGGQKVVQRSDRLGR